MKTPGASDVQRCLFAATLCGSSFCGPAHAQDAQPAAGDAADASPNIIFVLADDMGYGDVSALGQKNFTTTNLDRMAAEGIMFRQAYCGSTVCAPSRASMLTGMHTGHVYLRGNNPAAALRPDPQDVTVATLLRQQGYATALIGKSGLACQGKDAQFILDKGFDRFYGVVSHGAAKRHYPKTVYDQNTLVTIEGNNGATGVTYGDDLFLDQSLKFIRDNSDRPFFLHLALTVPHADLIVPEPFRQPFLGKFKEKPNTDSYYKQETPIAAYAGMIMFIDDAMGKLLDELKTLGIDDRTIVFFASDNGPSREGGKFPEDLDSNGPLRGGKRDLYEGGIRTPFIVRWPGHIAPGQTSDLPVAFWDFLPTALELAHAPAHDDTDGISIAPTLLGETGRQAEHDHLYWEFYEQGGKQAVRAGRWKGVRFNVGKDPRGPIELYDLDSDPSETTNIAAQHPDIVAHLAQLMDEEHEPSPVFAFDRGYIGAEEPALTH